MSRTNAAETDYLELLFQNTDWPNIGDTAGLQNSAAAGVFYVSLHTGDPGETGTQTTSEATFGSYARQSVSRSGATGWTVTGNTADNTAAITFGPSTGSPNETITHVGIGTDATGAGNLLWYGALDNSRLVNAAGITLEFAIGALNIQAD